MPLPVGDVTTLVEGGYPEQLAVTADTVYWTDFAEGVFSIAHADGVPEGNLSFFDGWINAWGILFAEDSIYWTQLNMDNSIRFQTVTGSHELIACNQQWPGTLAYNGGRLFWINEYIHSDLGRIMVLNMESSTLQIVIDHRADVLENSLTGNAAHFYWVEDQTKIMRMAFDSIDPS